MFWLFIAWAIAAVGLVFALLGRFVGTSTARVLALVALACNAVWLLYAFMTISEWYAGHPGIFALYWVANVLASAACAAVLVCVGRAASASARDR